MVSAAEESGIRLCVGVERAMDSRCVRIRSSFAKRGWARVASEAEMCIRREREGVSDWARVGSD